MGGIPQRTRAGKEGNLEMLYGTDLGSPPLNGFVTTKQFAATREDDLLKIINVYFHTAKYINADVDQGGEIIIKELNSRSGAKFTKADFRKAWNGLEHFFASPEDAQRVVLDSSGTNYWKTCWDDCNHYFYEIVKTIPAPVDSNGIFIMEKVQGDYIKKYGSK